MAERWRSAGSSSAGEGRVGSPPHVYFLTGATGFIGSRLARRLLAGGDGAAAATGATGATGATRVRCWARPTSDTSALERLGAEIVRGDLLDVDGLARALAGVDVAFHLAAIYDVGIVDVRAMERTNVGGTRAFLEAVQRAGTPRAVYVSTSAALGPVPAGMGDEGTEHGPRFSSAYERTKTEAHRLALAARAGGLPLIVACPAMVYGPGDHGPNGRYIRDILAGHVPGLPLHPAWYSYVHVDDVVEGLLLAGDRAPVGSVYVLSGEPRSINDFTKEVARVAGVRAPVLRLPAFAVRMTGSLMDAVSRVTGRRLPVTRENAESSLVGRMLHSHARATRELGWQPRPLGEGLPETIAWFRGAGAERPAPTRAAEAGRPGTGAAQA